MREGRNTLLPNVWRRQITFAEEFNFESLFRGLQEVSLRETKTAIISEGHDAATKNKYEDTRQIVDAAQEY